jgi:uncharacterized protein (UPF0210 family)
VQLIEVDALDPQPFEARLARAAQMSRAAAALPLVAARPDEAALGRDHQSAGIRMQRLRDEALVHLGAVGVRRIDEIDAELERPLQHAARRLRILRLAPDARPCEPHRTVAKAVYFQIPAERDRAGCCRARSRVHRNLLRVVVIRVESCAMASRRQILTLLGALGLPLSIMTDLLAASNDKSAANPLRVRTITTGLELSPRGESQRLASALEFLAAAKRSFVNAGYEVQTLRIAANPWLAGAAPGDRQKLLGRVRELDKIVTGHGAILSIGPVLTEDRADDSLAQWANELIGTTRSISFSVVISSPERAVHGAATTVAAQIMAALSRTLDGGVGNFRFAAAANIPAGTPFFPVAWHRDGAPEWMVIGLESASVVEQAFSGMNNGDDPSVRLKQRLEEVIAPVERVGRAVASQHERGYLGVDTSPAPGKDRSIAAAIEALTHAPFGSAGTLEACASITAALKTVGTATCGYNGLMLPVLEDPLLAQRAGEGRYSVRDLLLYSSVCGTGLDVVPIPGDTPVHSMAAILRDVAAMSARLRKPLSARLFLVPGKKVGEMARFNDQYLTDSMVMKLD